MKLTIAFLSVLIVFCYSEDLTQLGTLALADKIRSAGPEEISRNDIPAGLLQEVLEALRAKKAQRHLLRLGDASSVNELVRQFKSVDGKGRIAYQRLSRSLSPWVIPKLEGLLYEDEEPERRTWVNGATGNSDFGISHSTASIIIEILLTSPEIPHAVKEWARV